MGWNLDKKGCFHITGTVWNPSNGTDGYLTPWEAYTSKIRSVVTTEGASIDNCYGLFYNCTNLTTADLSHLDTSEVVYMTAMFCYCNSMTKVNLQNLNTSKVQYTNCMFTDCVSLENIDLTSFDTSQVQNMDSMFRGCTALTILDIGPFRTSNIVTMKNFFGSCNNLKLITVPAAILPLNAEALLTLQPKWMNEKTGEVYDSKEGLQKVTGTVSLISDSYANIEKLTNAWYGVTIRWKKLPGCTAIVYRKASTDSSWKKLTTTQSNGYYDKTAKNNTRYQYTIVLTKNGKTICHGKAASVLYMAPPKIQTVVNQSGSVKVSWSAVSGADGYFVYRKDTQKGNWHMIGTTQKNLYYNDTTVKNGIVYYYAIK